MAHLNSCMMILVTISTWKHFMMQSLWRLIGGDKAFVHKAAQQHLPSWAGTAVSRQDRSKKKKVSLLAVTSEQLVIVTYFTVLPTSTKLWMFWVQWHSVMWVDCVQFVTKSRFLTWFVQSVWKNYKYRSLESNICDDKNSFSLIWSKGVMKVSSECFSGQKSIWHAGWKKKWKKKNSPKRSSEPWGSECTCSIVPHFQCTKWP